MKPTTEELWEEIGFHKPLAGFWYNLIFNLINLALGVMISGVFLNIFYPFPESKGYVDLTTGIFALLITLFNLGTNNIINRFIAEVRIKDLSLMVKYIQYFIWYQMFTGLIQTTLISVYALFIVPQSNLAYGIWLMLIFSTKEYPGFLGVFRSILGSLQHFHRTAIIGFIQGEVFQRLTEAGFVLLGRWYGATHPEVGEILGIAMGVVIGTYVDDFLGTMVGASMFSRAMKTQGISARLCFGHDFRWEDIRAPLLFALKTGVPGIISGISAIYILTLKIDYFPQYASFIALISIVGTMMWIIGDANPNVTPLYTEAYLNGKKELTTFYIGQSWRFTGILIGFFASIFLIVFLFLEDAFIAMNILYYFGILPFFIPLLFKKVFDLFIDEAGVLIFAADRPNYIFITNLVGNILNMVVMTIVLRYMSLQTQGIVMLIFVLVFAESIAGYILTVINFVYSQKTIVKFKIPWWQTFIAPGFATFITFIIGYALKITLYESLKNQFGFYVALIPMIFIFLVLGIFVYFPLTAFFGGWDDKNVEDFEKVVQMSGPSKFLVVMIWNTTKKALKSPLHNKFRVDRTLAEKEAQELMELKKKNQLIM